MQDSKKPLNPYALSTTSSALPNAIAFDGVVNEKMYLQLFRGARSTKMVCEFHLVKIRGDSWRWGQIYSDPFP
ncbi:MAG: hypothetical protein ABL921_09770 [Pirellula sp.]